jgi:hypothetical protein
MPDNKNKDQQKQDAKKDIEDQENVENEDLGNEVEDDDRITQRSPRQGQRDDGQQGRNPQPNAQRPGIDRGK